MAAILSRGRWVNIYEAHKGIILKLLDAKCNLSKSSNNTYAAYFPSANGYGPKVCLPSNCPFPFVPHNPDITSI